MKFEVIGWTSYDNNRYPVHKGDVGAVERAVLEALRAGGYRFGGNRHQDDDSCTPVLNDGTRVCYSSRGWGGIMALALDIPDPKGMAYMQWYMDNIELLLGEPKRKIVTPPWDIVDDRLIKKRAELAENFEMPLCPEAFEAVVSGKKTAILRLSCGEWKCVCRGDTIDFLCGEERCRVRVTNAENFDALHKFFGTDPYAWESDFAFRHRRSLLRRARFGAYNTEEELFSYVDALYSEEDKKHYRAKAISFKKL